MTGQGARGVPADAVPYLWRHGWRHALTAGPEGIAAVRRLAEIEPALRPKYGVAMLAASSQFGMVRRFEEALTAAEEAVSVYAGLVEEDLAYEPEYAGALNNLAVVRDELGRPLEAVEPSEHAARIYRWLAAKNSAYLPELAGSLSNLAVRYGRIGRDEQALAAADEAVRLTQAAAERSEVHQPMLALALNNLGARLGDLGLDDEAVAPVEQSVAIYRRLAQSSPVFVPELARGLQNLTSRYTALGRPDAAVAADQEAVDLLRGLAERNDGFRSELDAANGSLALRYADLGRDEEAITLTRNAIESLRVAVERKPVHRFSLAAALTNLGVLYGRAGRYAEALGPSEESVALLRSLAEGNRAGVARDLATALQNLAYRYRAAEQPAKAVPVAEEAALLYCEGLAVRGSFDSLRETLDCLDDCCRAIGEPWRPQALWDRVMDGLAPDHAAHLLLAREQNAEDDVDRAGRELVAAIRDQARRLRTADPAAWDRAWTSLAHSEEPASWLTVDPELVETARQWIGTPDYESERDFLAEHEELLTREADVAVAEALLGGAEIVRHYMQIREDAHNFGVESVYQWLILGELFHHFAQAPPREQRRLLRERYDDLTGAQIRSALERLPERADPAEIRAWSVLWLAVHAGLDWAVAAVEAVDDPVRFQRLLPLAAQASDPQVLGMVQRIARGTPGLNREYGVEGGGANA